MVPSDVVRSRRRWYSRLTWNWIYDQMKVDKMSFKKVSNTARALYEVIKKVMVVQHRPLTEERDRARQ